jgi:hypothetical protein
MKTLKFLRCGGGRAVGGGRPQTGRPVKVIYVEMGDKRIIGSIVRA